MLHMANVSTTHVSTTHLSARRLGATPNGGERAARRGRDRRADIVVGMYTASSSGLAADYRMLASLASTDEAGGLAKERSVLLLWFLRNVVGLDDLDAYEYVCDGDADGGADGLYLESSSGDEDHETLVIYQSKYTNGPTQVGPTAFERLVAIASSFKDIDSLDTFLAGRVEPKLRALIGRFELRSKLREGRFSDGRLRIRLVLVATGSLTQEATNLVDATNRAERPGYLTVYDLNRLGPLARAVAAPTAPSATIAVPCTTAERSIIGTSPTRVAMAAVKAEDIVQWPGIDDRSIFELNVRREVRRNRVRKQLDGAIRRHHEHKDFLAYHNGMTVICDSFREEPDKLIVESPSVVNGAQSAIAFASADDEGELTDELRVFVKFIEVQGRPQLAKEISWRSNTQTAVNARNLVALGGPQARLTAEFEASFPGIVYETRPDASVTRPAGSHVIANDDAAQLLCAVFNAMPWLAVKRLVLFESENHALIFSEQITAANVVLADVIRQKIDDDVGLFPDRYRQSWRLTRIVAVYLVGQILRADPALKMTLDDPSAALADRAVLSEKLELPIRVTAATLKQRHDQRDRDDEVDAFNVDFKRQDVLHELRDRARDNFNLFNTVGSLSTP